MADDAALPPTRNIEVLLGLEVELALQLGRTVMALGDLLRLGPGSLIELSNKIGDPLAVFVNGRKIGEAEAVKVRQRFGVRILALLSRAERLQHLGV